jgi:hypothetical protein
MSYSAISNSKLKEAKKAARYVLKGQKSASSSENEIQTTKVAAVAASLHFAQQAAVAASLATKRNQGQQNGHQTFQGPNHVRQSEVIKKCRKKCNCTLVHLAFLAVICNQCTVYTQCWCCQEEAAAASNQFFFVDFFLVEL